MQHQTFGQLATSPKCMHNLYRCQYLGLSIAVGQEMPPNWIGLLLMIVRDKLTKNPSWSLYIQGFCATCLHVGSGWVPFKDWGSELRASQINRTAKDLQSGKPVDSMKAAPWKAWQEAVQDAIAAIQILGEQRVRRCAKVDGFKH